eukprot:9776066-Prorocentrum_lima.AAC.1
MTSSLVGSEMCIRDRKKGEASNLGAIPQVGTKRQAQDDRYADGGCFKRTCLLYTSDAADDM